MNYNYLANSDDGSCVSIVEGCNDYTAINYNSSANVDDGSCEYSIGGCMNNLYLEFNPDAQFSDGSCESLLIPGCKNPLFLEFDPLANVDDNSCETVRVEGCTSQIADNYNPLANDDIGTCTFNDVMTELSSVNDSLIVLNNMVVNCAATLEPIYIDLATGWNTIGFTLRNPQDVVTTIESILYNPNYDAEDSTSEQFNFKLIKNNDGAFIGLSKVLTLTELVILFLDKAIY